MITQRVSSKLEFLTTLLIILKQKTFGINQGR